MIPALRKSYNAAFTEEKYAAMLRDVESTFGRPALFKLAEILRNLPADYKALLLQACGSI